MSQGNVRRAPEPARTPGDTANRAAASVTAGDTAQRAASSVGSGMHSLAGAVRENLPKQGMVGNVAASVAQGLDRGGRYLENEGFSGMANDLTATVRRYPVPALLTCVGLGYFLAKLTSRR